MSAAETALAEAKSVHVRGAFTRKGVTGRVDLRLSRDAATGTLTGPFNGKTYTIGLVSTRDGIYIRSPQLWQAIGGAALAERIGDRWVLTPKNSRDFADLYAMSDIRNFAKEVLTPDDKVTKGARTVVSGTPAIGVADSAHIMYVATTGTPYPLKIVPKKAAKPGEEVAFLEYGVPFQVTPPSNAVNMSDLQ